MLKYPRALPVHHVNIEKCRIGLDIRLQHASGFMQELTNGRPKMLGVDVMP